MPKKPAVSMRRETYEKLKEEAQKRDIAISALLQEILDKTFEHIDQPCKDNRHIEVGTPLRPVDREYFDNPTAPPMLTPQDSPATRKKN